jgi:nickel transport protein
MSERAIVLSAIVKPLIAALLLAGPAAAHGAFVDMGTTEAVAIQARYDTGALMAGAQVSVFAPDNPAQPWLTGMTDADGRFVFVPDDRAGQWAVQVRQAGHGAMGYVTVGTDGAAITVTASRTGLSWAQRLLMVASVVWGCIGTALYFRRLRPAEPA